MERTNFEVYDWMKEHQQENDYTDEFIEAYKKCYFLCRLSGKFFHGVYSGYSITPDNDDKHYFVEEGIRGVEEGYFTVINGKLIQLDPLTDAQNYDKYSDLVKKISDYVYNKLMSVESLSKITSKPIDVTTQINDHINSLQTIYQLLSKY